MNEQFAYFIKRETGSSLPRTSFIYVPTVTVKVTAWQEQKFEFIWYFLVESWGKKKEKLGRNASVCRERMAGHLDENHSQDWWKGRANAPFHDNFLHFLFLFPHLNYTEAQHVVRALVKICIKLNMLTHFWRKTWCVIRDESLSTLDKYWSLLFNLTVNLITDLCFTRTTCGVWKSHNMYCTSSFPLQVYHQLHFSSPSHGIMAQ